MINSQFTMNFQFISSQFPVLNLIIEILLKIGNLKLVILARIASIVLYSRKQLCYQIKGGCHAKVLSCINNIVCPVCPCSRLCPRAHSFIWRKSFHVHSWRSADCRANPARIRKLRHKRKILFRQALIPCPLRMHGASFFQ